MRRILIVGAPGVGKSTFGRALSGKLGIAHIELDALYHGPNWTPRPTFEEDVERASRADEWILDGNYRPVRDLLWSRADTIVWLDLPRLRVLSQVIRRSVLRWIRDEELWNGNRENGPRHWLEPDHPILWGWNRHALYRVEYAMRFDDATYAHARKHRLRTHAEIAHFLDQAGRIGK